MKKYFSVHDIGQGLIFSDEPGKSLASPFLKIKHLKIPESSNLLENKIC